MLVNGFLVFEQAYAAARSQRKTSVPRNDRTRKRIVIVSEWRSNGSCSRTAVIRTGIAEILNLQPRGSVAKAYQVKQVRAVIIPYRLAEEAK